MNRDWFTGYPESALRYLSRGEVIECVSDIDLMSTVERTLCAHAGGTTVLPDEAYLGWTGPDGTAARLLAMPGAIGAIERTVGIKVIGGCLGNPSRGVARSQGLVLLVDPDSARPRVIMEAAYISALRTAAVSVLSARLLGRPGLRTAAVVGCGTLARAHLSLLPSALPTVGAVTLYDVERGRAESLATDAERLYGGAGPRVRAVATARDAVRGADLVVTATTVTDGYLPYGWLSPGAVVAHVSLDDVLPEVVQRADLVVVDDWNLVRSDHRRLLGRMYRQGALRGPDGGYCPQAPHRPDARRVDATLGEIVAGTAPARRSDRDLVLCNPFGMAILDVAVAAEVAKVAGERGVGHLLPI